jgi:Arc/MetJ family transcription regulator
MRTNIDIDDDLMAQTMAATGAKTKKAAVEEAMREFVRFEKQRKGQTGLRALRGKVEWIGDLDEMRSERNGLTWS